MRLPDVVTFAGWVLLLAGAWAAVLFARGLTSHRSLAVWIVCLLHRRAQRAAWLAAAADAAVVRYRREREMDASTPECVWPQPGRPMVIDARRVAAR